MPVARLQFSVYQSSNENGGGGHAWTNVPGAGATAEGAGAYSIRDPNSADMNWLRSNGDGARGSATIPAGSIVTGIIIGFQAHCTGGNQVGGSYTVQIFKAGNPVGTAKTGSIGNEGFIGPFGATNDLWGLGALATPTYFTNMYFGHHLNFPNITANIAVYSWNGYMDIYYNDPVPIASSIETAGGNNQSIQISTSYPQPLKALVRDQGGSPMAGKNVTFTMPASGASALFSNSTRFCNANTDANGIATSLNFQANATTGNFQPVADITGSSPLIFTQFSTTNLPAPVTKVPTTITIQAGNNQQATISTAFANRLMVLVKDQFSANMPNVDITWTPPGSGASGLFQGGNPARIFTDVNGIGTAPVLFSNANPGAWSLPVVATGFPAVTVSFSFTNLSASAPPVPTAAVLVSGGNQSAALNANFANPIQVRILDQYGAAYPGATVVATTPGTTYGTFVANSSVTRTVLSNAQGLADFGTLKAGASPQTLWAITITGNAVVAGVDTFAAAGSIPNLNNVDATIVTSINGITGIGQIAAPGTAFASALVARATNGLGNGVANYPITFTAPSTGQSCTFLGAITQVVNTDVNGNATSAIPVANSIEGKYVVTATGAGLFVNALADPGFPLQNGNTYGTEVCTTFVATLGGSNSTLGQVGTPLAWTNPGSVIDAAGGGTFARNFQQPPNSNRSQGLLAAPIPANWTAVPNDAKITQIKITFSARGVNGVGTFGSLFTAFSGVAGAASLAVSGITTTFAGFTRTFVPSGFTTGADLKAANVGWYFNNAPSSGTGTSTGIDVNGVTVSVCYQPLIPPVVQGPMPPLMLCEA